MASAGTLTIDVQAGIASLQSDFQRVAQATDTLGTRIAATTARMEAGFAGVTSKLSSLAGLMQSAGLGSAGAALTQVATAAETLGAALRTVGSAASITGTGLVANLTRIVGVGTGVVGVASALQSMGLGINAAGEAAQTAQTATASYDAAVVRLGISAETATQSVERLALAEANAALQARNLQNELALGEQLAARSTLPDRLAAARATAARAEAASVTATGRLDQFPGPGALADEARRRRGAADAAQLEVVRLEQEQASLDARIAELQRGRVGGQDSGRILSTAPFGPTLPTTPTPARAGGGAARTDPDAALIERLERLGDPFRAFDQEVAEIQRLFDANKISVDAYNKSLEDLSRRQNSLGTSTRELEQPLTQTQLMLVNFSDEISKAVVSPFFEAEQDIGKALLGILRKVLEFIVQMTVIKPLLQAAVQFLPAWAGGTPTSGTSTGGGIAATPGVAASSYGGQRAGGGRVAAGTGYTVGEFGPERFIPDTAGRIDPSGGEVTVNVYNQAEGTTARQEQRANPFGGKEIDVYIEKIVGTAMANGRFDNVLGANFGASRVGRV